MTNTTYNERDHDGTNQVNPDWYSRFIDFVVGYHIADSILLPLYADSPSESSDRLPR